MEEFVNAQVKHFNYLMNKVDATYHEAARKLGMSDSVMHILYTICNHGESCLLSDICNIGISKQTINSAIRKLEAEKIVYLEQFGGKRKCVCLTEKGKEFVKQTVVHVIEAENEIFESWSKEELELYLELTQRYLQAFQKKIKTL